VLADPFLLTVVHPPGLVRESHAERVPKVREPDLQKHRFMLRAPEPAEVPTVTNVTTPPAVVHFHRACRPGLGAVHATRRLLSGLAGAFAIVTSVAFVIPSAAAFDSDAGDQQSAHVQTFSVAEATSEAETASVADADSVGALAVAPRDDYGVTAPPPVQWPLPPTTPMSSDFGPRSCSGCSSDHQGIDLNAASGTPIEAIAAGVVVETNAPGYAALGVHARIQHLIDGQMVTSVYAHMQTGSMGLRVGDFVEAGQVVGLLGCTGSCTGAHLHFEVHPDGGAAVDPVAFLAARVG